MKPVVLFKFQNCNPASGTGITRLQDYFKINFLILRLCNHLETIKVVEPLVILHYLGSTTPNSKKACNAA